MPEHKISVDDILNEIQLNKAKSDHNMQSGDMRHIDKVIREILVKKQEEKLKEENRVLTDKERASLEKEIKAQTRSLTKEFEKFKREQKKQNDLKKSSNLSYEKDQSNFVFDNDSKSPASSLKTKVKNRTSEKEQQIKIDSAPFQFKMLLEEETEQIYKGSADTTDSIKDIGGHFGNHKMRDAVKEEDLKTKIKLNDYKNYKNKRNTKVKNFVLESKEKEKQYNEKSNEFTAKQEKNISETVSEENVQKPSEINYETQYANCDIDEYTDPSQAKKIESDLSDMLHSVKIVLIMLGAVSINAFLAVFSSIHDGSVYLLFKFAVTPFLFAVINLILLILAMIASFSIWGNIIRSIKNKNSSKDLFYLTAVIICFISNIVFCIHPEELTKTGVCLFTPIVILMLFVDFISKYQNIMRTINNFKFVSDSGDKFAVEQVTDQHTVKNMVKKFSDKEPILVKNIKYKFLDHFMTHSFEHDASDCVMQKMLCFALPISFVLAGAVYFLKKDIYIAMTFFSGCMILSGGFISALIVSLPLKDTIGIVKQYGGMMPDYNSIEKYKDIDTVLIDACDLFPEKSVVLHGIKTFQGNRIDDAIIDAASVVCTSKSVLKDIFLTIINHDTNLLRKVDSTQYEDLMGISAWVSEKKVLIGNRDLMINHSVAVPKKDYEDKYHENGNEIIYLATGGELCAAFILEFTANKSVTDVVRLLHKNNVAAVVKTVDSCVTSQMLSNVFKTDKFRFEILLSNFHKEFDEQHAGRDHSDSMLGNNGSLFGYIVSVAMTKKLHHCIRFGIVFYLISAILGVFLMAAVLFTGKFTGAGNFQAMVFMFIVTIFYWIYEKNMRL